MKLTMDGSNSDVELRIQTHLSTVKLKFSTSMTFTYPHIQKHGRHRLKIRK